MLNVFVGRQPIYNQLLKVVGYELLFRSYEGEEVEIVDGDRATSEVIINTFLEIGLEQLVGSKLAFINLTRSFILAKYPLPLLENRVVLEVLEDVKIDEELIDGLEFLSDRGYKIALDDVVDPDDVAPLLDIVDIVKLDIKQVDQSFLEEYVSALKKHKVRILAEKIETYDLFNTCKKLGFHYYQGFFFSRPNVITGRKIPDSHLNTLRLLSKLHSPSIEFKEIEEIVRQDVSLSYKLLRLINSSFYARPKKINSIRQALTLLGIRKVLDWVSLLYLSRIENKPRELITTSIVRARMCELLAQSMKIKKADAGFTIGLLSVLDALLDLPLEQIVSSLPLADEIMSALLHHQGELGELLHCVLAYEHGEWDKVEHSRLKPDEIRDIYLESVQWTDNISSLL